MTAMTPRRQATRKRRRAILDAALACFLRNGFEAATLEHIRDASGASFGSIYHHFGSKQAIAVALYDEGLRELETRLTESRTPHGDWRAGIRSQVKTYFEWLADNRDLALFLFRISTADQVGPAAQEIDSVSHRSQSDLADWLRPFVERGEVVPMPDDLYDTVIYGPCSHFARHWLAGRGKLDFDEVVRHLSEAIIRGLATGRG